MECFTPPHRLLFPLTLALAASFVGANALAATVDLSLDSRWRTEFVDNRFRPTTARHEEVHSSKTSLAASVTWDHWYLDGELHDARAWGFGDDSAVDTAYINTLEPLQAKLGWRGKLGPTRTLDVSVGRTTLEWQEGRLFGRQGFRTTLESFTGARGVLRDATGWQAEAIAVFYNPITPGRADRSALDDRKTEYDTPTSGTRITGLNISGITLGEATELAAYVVYISEEDRPGHPTYDRDLLTAGSHVRGQHRSWDWRVEGAVQTGRRSPLKAQNAGVRGDILAGFVHLEAQRPVTEDWRFGLVANYASGDSTPESGTLTSYDTLYTSNRKGDFNFTGLWGPYKNSNVLSPSLQLHWRPQSAWQADIQYRPAWRHARQDSGGGLEFYGHEIEAEIDLSPADSPLSWHAGVGYFRASETTTAESDAGHRTSLYAFIDVNLRFIWTNY